MNKKNEQPRHKNDHDAPRLSAIKIDRIKIWKGHRAHDTDAVNDMALSIREVGVITPVVVTRAGKDHAGKNTYGCVSGALRISGAKLAGRNEICALVLNGDEDYVQLCRIAADLFRDDLTVLQKAEYLKDWTKIILSKGAQSAKRGGHQPHDKGLSNAAKVFKLSRRMAGRLETVGGLSPEVKAAIKDAKLDNSQKSMLAIAKENTDEERLRKVGELRLERVLGKTAARGTLGSPSLVPEESSNTDLRDADFEKLKIAWESSPAFIIAWADAPLPTRERFIAEILRQSSRENAPQADKAVGHE